MFAWGTFWNNVSFDEADSFLLTWHLQLVPECVCTEVTEPGWVLLQIPWLFLEASHGQHQLIHSPKIILIFTLLVYLRATWAKKLLYFFGECLLETQRQKIQGLPCTVTYWNNEWENSFRRYNWEPGRMFSGRLQFLGLWSCTVRCSFLHTVSSSFSCPCWASPADS